MTEPTDEARGWMAWALQYWPVIMAPGFPLWAVVRWFKSETNADAAREAAERRRQDDVDTAQERRLTAEIVRKDALLAAKDEAITRISQDRDRGWDLARWWRATAADNLAVNRDYVHSVAGWITPFMLLLEQAGMAHSDPPVPPSLVKLPSLEYPEA